MITRLQSVELLAGMTHPPWFGEDDLKRNERRSPHPILPEQQLQARQLADFGLVPTGICRGYGPSALADHPAQAFVVVFGVGAKVRFEPGKGRISGHALCVRVVEGDVDIVRSIGAERIATAFHGQPLCFDQGFQFLHLRWAHNTITGGNTVKKVSEVGV